MQEKLEKIFCEKRINMLLKKGFRPIVDDLVVDIKMTSSVLVCSIMKQTKLRMSIGNIAGTAAG